MKKIPFTLDEIKQNINIQENLRKDILENNLPLHCVDIEEEPFPGFSKTLFKATYYVGYCKSGVFQVSVLNRFFNAYPYYVNFDTISYVEKNIIEAIEKQREKDEYLLLELQQTIVKLGYEKLWVCQQKGTQPFQLALAKCKKGKKPEDFLKEKEYAKIEHETYLISLKEGIYHIRFNKGKLKEIKDVSQKRDYVKRIYKNSKSEQTKLENKVKNMRFLLEKNKVRSLFLI